MFANTKPVANTNLKLVIGFSFVLVGVVSVLLGQILPILSTRFDLNDAQAGTFFFAQFSGSLIGTLVSGRLARTFGFVGVLALGFALMILGLPLLNFHTYFVCWLAIFLYGMGTGLAIPAGNLITIETTPLERQAAAVNLMNFCWGTGAILCQPFVAAVSENGSLVFVSWPIAAMFVVTLVTLASIRRISPAKEDENEPAPISIWREPFTWTFALFSFLIIGIEAGLSGWLTTYSNLLQSEGALSINAAFVYFASFVIGRALASLISHLISDNALIATNAALLITGIALLAIGSRETALPGAILAGLGTSAIFPTHMVRFSKVFGPAATQQATPIFVFAILGAASTSWLIGFISTWSGSLRNGIALLLAAAALLTTLQIVISRIYKANAAL